MTKILALAVVMATSATAVQSADEMNAVAERYAHLVLALGQHDPDYVDAFYGPAEWKANAEKEKKSLDAIGAEAAELAKKLMAGLEKMQPGTAAATEEAKRSD